MLLTQLDLGIMCVPLVQRLAMSVAAMHKSDDLGLMQALQCMQQRIKHHIPEAEFESETNRCMSLAPGQNRKPLTVLTDRQMAWCCHGSHQLQVIFT